MFIIPAAPSTFCAMAKVRAFRVSASSWLCSAITPARQQLALHQASGAERARQELRLVVGAVGLDQSRERLLVPVAVVVVLDLVVRGGAAAEPHDLVHRGDVLRAHLDTGEAVGTLV